jgi:hypothetical protein
MSKYKGTEYATSYAASRPVFNNYEVGSLKWARRTHPMRFAMLRESRNTCVGPRNLKGGQSIQIPDLL